MTDTDSIDDWAMIKAVFVDGMVFSGEGESVTLGILKQGKRLYLFVNDTYLL